MVYVNKVTVLVLEDSVTGQKVTIADSELWDTIRAMNQATREEKLDRAWQQEELERTWRLYALTGSKIDAIRAYRELTKAGLKDAKDAVEFFMNNLSKETNKLLVATKQIVDPEDVPVCAACHDTGCGACDIPF